jgi:hypothetical protein
VGVKETVNAKELVAAGGAVVEKAVVGLANLSLVISKSILNFEKYIYFSKNEIMFAG